MPVLVVPVHLSRVLYVLFGVVLLDCLVFRVSGLWYTILHWVWSRALDMVSPPSVNRGRDMKEQREVHPGFGNHE